MQLFSRAEGCESGFNAEAQEAQRGEGGDFGRVDGGASRLDLDGGTCETRETCRTNECLNLAGEKSRDTYAEQNSVGLAE